MSGIAVAPHVLVICPRGGLPPGVQEILRRPEVHVEQRSQLPERPRPEMFHDFDACLIVWSEHQPDRSERHRLAALLRCLEAARVSTVMLGPDGIAGMPIEMSAGLVTAAPESASGEQLWSHLATATGYRTVIRRLERELDRLEQLGRRMGERFAEMDQELRLASRLQQDFLPRQLPEVGGVRFAHLYRPASWVSGDMYDVLRLDEDHVGFYVADAVGHGLAAGLLTMFIKRAIQTKRIEGDRYEIIHPSETLALLNDSLASQNLPNCQFVTACYAVLNCRTLEMVMARGGHPHPLYIEPDGTVHELRTSGGLLGVFAQQDYPALRVLLRPGDKVMIYSDGIEGAIIEERDTETGELIFRPEFLALASLPARDLVDRLGEHLDGREGSLNPDDDVTVVIAEVDPTASPEMPDLLAAAADAPEEECV